MVLIIFCLDTLYLLKVMMMKLHCKSNIFDLMLQVSAILAFIRVILWVSNAADPKFEIGQIAAAIYNWSQKCSHSISADFTPIGV